MNLLKASVLLSLALTTPNISLADELSDAENQTVSYTHLTLPTNREV